MCRRRSRAPVLPSTWITRAGGTRLNLILERPLLIVECWAADSVAAFDLAARACAYLGAIDDPLGDVVLTVTPDDLSSPINMPDPDTTSARYQFTVQPFARLKEMS